MKDEIIHKCTPSTIVVLYLTLLGQTKKKKNQKRESDNLPREENDSDDLNYYFNIRFN
jgi:hypothetical protein